MPNPVFDTEAMLDQLRKDPEVLYKDERGFASQFDHNPTRQTLWNYGAVVPLGAAAAALWYLNRRNKKQKPAAQPALKFAEKQAVDWQQILENIKFHLPRIRIPDTAAGMLAGGAAGGIYDWLRGGETGPDGKKKRNTAQRMLMGALLGAGGANVLGDRFRRYVSNRVIPLGYSAKATEQLVPKKLQDFVDAAILDKPTYDQETYNKMFPGYKLDWANNSQLGSRQEIVRRAFGLPLNAFAAKDPFWQRNNDGTYSLNEQSPHFMDRLRRIFGPAVNSPVNSYRKLTDAPGKFLDFVNKSPEGQTDFMAKIQVLGAQQMPYRAMPDGTVQARVLDRFDLTPSDKEHSFLLNPGNLWRFITDKKWRDAPLKENFGDYMIGHTNASALTNIGSRLLWDNVLAQENPWISQKFRTLPAPPTLVSKQMGGRGAPAPPPPAQQLQFLQHDNTPATKPMDRYRLDDWLRWTPAVQKPQ